MTDKPRSKEEIELLLNIVSAMIAMSGAIVALGKAVTDRDRQTELMPHISSMSERVGVLLEKATEMVNGR